MTTELLSLTPVLALAFTDVATGERVVDGLAVTVAHRGRTLGLAHADGGRGWSLHELRGPVPDALTVTVRDAFGRFLPVRTVVATADPPPVLITLASAPARPAPASHAQVRATVLDEQTRAPLPGLRLEVTCADVTATGFADARGDVLVLLPWPRATPAMAAKPPPDRTFAATVKVAVPDPAPPADAFALDPAAAFANRPALPEQELHYGVPLVLHSAGETALLIA